MLLKTEDKKEFELSFRPVADPTEIINEKTDKKTVHGQGSDGANVKSRK